mgnify:FL=1
MIITNLKDQKENIQNKKKYFSIIWFIEKYFFFDAI